MTDTTTTTTGEHLPLDQLSLACIDAVSRQVEWNPARVGYDEAFKHTVGEGDNEREVVLVSHNNSVVAVFTADGERVDIGWDREIDDYLDDHRGDDGELLPGAFTEAELTALREVEPTMHGSEGPMMNYFYPLNERSGDTIGGWGNSTDEVGAAYLLRDLPLCVVERDDELGLALTGGGTDLTWEIVEAYVALGYLPPVAFSDLPGAADRPREGDGRVIEAVRRSLTAMVSRMQSNLDRHNERYPAPRPQVEDDESDADSPIAQAAARLNRAAMLYPVTDSWTKPCVEVAGVQAYLYIDDLGRLRVSVDTETSVLPARADGTTPMIICLNEAVVLDDSGKAGVDIEDDRMTLGDSNPFARQFLKKFGNDSNT